MSIESSIKWLSKRLTNDYDIKAMNEIIEWLYKEKGEAWMSDLRVKAHAIAKLKLFEKQELLDELTELLNKVENYKHE